MLAYALGKGAVGEYMNAQSDQPYQHIERIYWGCRACGSPWRPGPPPSLSSSLSFEPTCPSKSAFRLRTWRIRR